MNATHTSLMLCALLLAGCGGGGGLSGGGCQNTLGDSCKATVPEGSFSATPATTSEGKALTLNLDIFDTDPNDTVTCELDPLGDGSSLFKSLSCPTTLSYVYQESGTFVASVKATDTQDNVLESTTNITIVESESAGTAITKFRLFDNKLFSVRNASFCIRPLGAPSGCSPVTITEGPPAGTYFAVPGLPTDNPAANPFKIIITLDSDEGPIRDTIVARVDADNTRATVDFSIPFDCTPSSGNCKPAEGVVEQRDILSGIITSAATGLPVLGAEIDLISLEDGTTKLAATAISGENGQYELQTSQDETAIVRVRVTGFREAISTVKLERTADQDNPIKNIYYFGFNFALEPLPDGP